MTCIYMNPQNITVRLRFSVHDTYIYIYIYANCGAIAVIENTTYMTIMELFDEWPALSSREMMTIMYNNIYNY